MGKGGFGGPGPPRPPLWKPALTMPARRKRLCALCFENSLRLASPRSELRSAGLEPRAIFIFPLHRARGLGKTGAGAQPSSGRRAWRCSPQKPPPFPRGLSTFCPRGFFGGDGEAALLLGGSAPWEGRWGTLGRGPGRTSRPTRTPRGRNPTQSAGFAPFALLPSAPGHCPAENRGSAVPFPPHSASCRGDKDLALSRPCRTPPGPRLGGAHEAGRGLGWVPRRGGRCRASARSREGPEGFVLPGPQAGQGDRRELRRAPGMLRGGRRSWEDPPAEGDISPRPGTSRTNTAAT